jgi:hypothetical protein
LTLGYQFQVPDHLVHNPTYNQLKTRSLVSMKEGAEHVKASQSVRTQFAKEMQNHQVTLLHSAQKVLSSMTTDEQVLALAEAPKQKPTTRRSKHQAGDYVRIWLGEALRVDKTVLNKKFSGSFWSEPYRVVATFQDGAVLDVAQARNPLSSDRVSWMQVKSTRLEPSIKQRFDELFNSTMVEKAKSLEASRLAANKSRKWINRSSDDEEHEVLRILDSRKDGKGLYSFLVQWVGETAAQATWEPQANLRNASEAIQEYQEKLRKPASSSSSSGTTTTTTSRTTTRGREVKTPSKFSS